MSFDQFGNWVDDGSGGMGTPGAPAPGVAPIPVAPTTNPQTGAVVYPTGTTPPNLNSNAPSATDLTSWYEQYTGRAPSATDIAGWSNGTYTDPAASPDYIRNQIATSGEAQAYAAKNKPPASSAYVPGQGVPGQGTVFSASNPLTAETSALGQYLLSEGTGSSSANPAFSTDPNSPFIQARVNAFGATQQQNARNNLAALAERKGPNSNLGAETRLAGEQVGQATSGYEATLLGQQLQARQQEIESALSGAQGVLTAEQSMMLQEELAQLQLAQQSYMYDTTQNFLESPLAPSAVGG